AGPDSIYGAGKLNIEFDLDSLPVIDSVVDVPGDQGLEVEISWTKSGYDFSDSPRPIVEYDIFRKGESAGWDSMQTVPASCAEHYAAVVPTLKDSTITEGVHFTTFIVRARTAAPGIFYESAPDSGYSVDNLIPPVPTGLVVAYNTGSGNLLTWDRSGEPDVDSFRVYRGESDGFVPATDNLVKAVIDTFWLDTVPEGWRYCYKVTAVDDAGNESAPASPSSTTEAETQATPEPFALHQNIPNPFNPITTIRFDVPKRGRVRLAVYDVQGRLVRVLLDGEVDAGSRELVWNGKDVGGRNVSSGVYFYSLETPGFTQSRKMILMR
ncbi:MAG: T9SS type A sorting domain-containing protein, partial [Candidatus Krumholzibacteria bacterium]|nr:T9SS type A sorting domain-containing protein [Candidatus Krumholzibacteria bacterium]